MITKESAYKRINDLVVRIKTKLQTKISQIESKIDYCENRINQIVYQLYDLTEEEIKIVEVE
jgi:hypothetical protein